MSELSENQVREIVKAEMNGCSEILVFMMIIALIITTFVGAQLIANKKMRGLEQRIGVLEAMQKATK